MGLSEGLLNDAFSASKEKDPSGAPSPSYVFMHMHEHGCDELEALRAVADWHNECIREAVRLGDEIVRAFASEYPRMEAYVHGLHLLIRGNADWSVGTARYGRLDGYELRVVEMESSQHR